MKYTATIEIPKGSDRRIHMSYDKTGFIDLGPIKEQIPINEGVMPVHYGYIDGTLNKEEGDEVDVIIFSKNSYNTGDKIEVHVVGMLKREDGDNKVIAHDDSEEDFVFEKLSDEDKKLMLDYFGFKSKIVSVNNREQGLEYLENNVTKNI